MHESVRCLHFFVYNKTGTEYNHSETKAMLLASGKGKDMEKKKSLYRGKKNLDYEIPFEDKQESLRRIKEHMRENKKKQNRE